MDIKETIEGLIKQAENFGAGEPLCRWTITTSGKHQLWLIEKII
jgi:hypothetical protein